MLTKQEPEICVYSSLSKETSHSIHWLHLWTPWREWNTKAHKCLHSFRLKRAQVPIHDGSPIMCDKKHLLHTQRINESNKVIDNVIAGVAGDGSWCISVTEALEIWCYSMVSKWAQSMNLVAPGVPKLREAMEE